MGPNYVTYVHCSLPMMKDVVWRYESSATVMGTSSTPVNVTVCGGELAIYFTPTVQSDGCTTAVAMITSRDMHRNSSTGPFVLLSCTDLEKDITVPVTVEGEAILFPLHLLGHSNLIHFIGLITYSTSLSR